MDVNDLTRSAMHKGQMADVFELATESLTCRFPRARSFVRAFIM